ncbi:helix-turn-helix domain-containing protein [Parafrankia sp. FMc2]|uniref:helix-turn-helix domain-containing protein n=1 Tax=Parafrankia sp. FMc2 TaxID=3233196 RepID=UPI0034D57563
MEDELRLYAAAKRAGVTPRTVLDWIADEELRAIWCYGTGWHIAKRELDRVARAHRS